MTGPAAGSEAVKAGRERPIEAGDAAPSPSAKGSEIGRDGSVVKLPLAASALRRRLLSGIECRPAAARRLAHAGTSVVLSFGATEEEAVTLLLDRYPVEVLEGAEPAEARLELDTAQAWLFAAGRLPLPALLYAGEVAFSGPVRKYLTVHPILAAALAEATEVAGGRRQDEDG